ncbi:SpoIIE family protein phosphatase [Actinoplanes sp. Pm04-4]|uniref:SpoIIE family protein phosphatase n=1 Tax=Paractinoplanes pyxinae TaxID=2997416 RepID=A0ABT4BDA7_9ACTN|nr:SpoIIE family protein phosphatase [Actinoplanes pyxinae]MCY1143593.1 SpoIIE family protein phosphatase [Actinoplanes pyxinae]
MAVPVRPELPDAVLAARYLVASPDKAAGGDRFDAVPLADGSVALVVGDIVGHGVAASAAMSQLRSVLNAVLTRTGDLEQALDWADDLAARAASMRAATVCVAVLEPATGRLRYTTCGHPPPLATTPEGATRFLPPSGGGPLGTGSQRVIAEATLADDEVLLLYTDGLIERPGQSTRDAMTELATVIGDAVANRLLPVGAPESAPERVCEQGMELITRRGYDDDVTALAVQRRPAPVTPLSLDLLAEPGGLAVLRETIRDWSRQMGPAVRDEQAIDLAVSELMANAIEHADRLDVAGRGGVFPIEIDLSDGELLASAAVRVLFHARDRSAAHGHPLTLRAVPGSNAADVLDLVGLPWQPATVR